MNLSDVTTEDGVTIKEGGTYYEVCFTLSDQLIAKAVTYPMLCNGYILTNVNRCVSSTFPIHHGRAVGLWASRETLEAGLGKGKV